MSCLKNAPCSGFVEEIDLCCLVTGTFPDSCTVEGQPVDQDKIDNSIQAASELLWAATGRQFGLCTVKIRPCRQDKGCDPCPDGGSIPFFDFSGFTYGFGFPWLPVHTANGWINVPPCACPNICGCDKLCQIELPYPVCCIDEVKVDGIVLPTDNYRVDEFRWLVRTKEAGSENPCWSTCQNLLLEDTEEDTFSVTVTYGREVPQLVKQATAELACQFLKSCVGAPCQLPQRLTSVTRQGISVSFLDTMDFIQQGMTGLYLVDLAIRTYNPKGLARRPTVFSPDYTPKWRRTGTGGGNCP